MRSLAVAIVCKNNEKTIGRVLEACAELVDGGGEIVAVDSGSTDGTIALLEKHNARIIRTEWKGHVATKQLAYEAADRPWVLCLDSDEPPDPDLRRSILDAVTRDDPAIGGYQLNRKIWYRGRYLNHAWQPEWRTRLVRKGAARWMGEDPHDRLDVVAPNLKTARLDGTLRHESFETFAEHLAKQVSHSRVGAKSLFAAGRRSSYFKLATSPLGAFLKQIVIKSAWRDGFAGWLAAGSTAAGALMKHMMLLELQRTERSN